jgi:cellulose synthase/poly-beta-1,6-N-acetylglucosamine synthase-like glycosyltransferase
LAETVFWTLLALVAYAYAGYPLLLWVCSRVVTPHPVPVDLDADPSTLPRLSIVVPSHNEGETLRRRLQNLRTLNYPAEKVDIVAGLDGVDELPPDEEPHVRVVVATERVGKTALLNRMVGRADADIVVFTDANAVYERDALRYLAAPFANPRVGCVTGELVYSNRGAAAVRSGEGLYWRLENSIKEMEGRFGGTLVATGAIYAMRRSLCRPLPPGISDDSTNPLVALAAGYRVVVEKRARAVERAATTMRDEFSRKTRMVTRQLGAHAHVHFLLKPFRPVLAFRLVSHKLLRWLVPFWLLGALAANLALLDSPLYRATLAIALTLIGLFIVGAIALRRSIPLPAPIRMVVYLGMINAAAFIGVIDFLRGRERAVWTISQSTRESEPPAV